MYCGTVQYGKPREFDLGIGEVTNIGECDVGSGREADPAAGSDQFTACAARRSDRCMPKRGRF